VIDAGLVNIVLAVGMIVVFGLALLLGAAWWSGRRRR
jgi:hypothetical protein